MHLKGGSLVIRDLGARAKLFKSGEILPLLGYESNSLFFLAYLIGHYSATELRVLEILSL